MTNKDSGSSSGGIGFSGLLTILFVGLKLTGYIDWSWWWVFAPIWVWIPIVLVIVAILLMVEFVFTILEG